MKNYFLINSVSMNGHDLKISFRPDDEGENYYSIIVGVNGAGKSRLLERIGAGVFLSCCFPYSQAESEIMFRTVGGFSTRSVFNGHHLKFSSLKYYEQDIELSVSFLLNGVLNNVRYLSFNEVSINYIYNNQDVSTKVICISNSIYNRFFTKKEVDYFSEMYGYYGYKNLSISEDLNSMYGYSDGVNNKVVGGFYSEVICKSFSKSNEITDKNLDFIERFGFDRYVSISLSLGDYSFGDYTGEYFDDFNYESISKIFNFEKIDPIQKDHAIKLLLSVFQEINLYDRVKKMRRESYCHSSLRDLLFIMSRTNGIGEVKFPDSNVFESGLAGKITELLDLGLIVVNDVTLKKKGHSVGLKNMSSGELNCLLMLLKINSEIEDNSLILIDEPEISMHPAWQREVIPSLKKCFSEFKGCHFIIATHSPQVVSSIPEKNSSVVILGESNKVLNGFLLKGLSADHLLFSTLDSPGEHNEYATRVLTTILAKLTLKKDLSVKETLFLEKAIESYPLDNKEDEHVTMKRLLKQVIALYAV
ncbi:AAA family ATPase [Klebsiella variicola]